MEIVLMNDNAIKPTRASKESAGLELCSSIDVDIGVVVSNIMYPEIKKVKFLKDTERNNKGFGEMDKINFSKRI